MIDLVLPLFLRVAGRGVVVFGAGSIATRKIAELVEAGAQVRVVSPDASDEVKALAAAGRVTWTARGYEKADLDDAWLVVSATDDAVVQRAIFDDAEARRLFVLAIDDPQHGSAMSGAVVRRPPFVIAISSSAEVPALTRLVREIIERALPEDRWIAAAKELRARWKRDKTPMASRFGELLRDFARRGDDGRAN
ncbi:MAG: siroheme synthase, partial [Myxococcaceae bacterium]|nr:siroheme synthase [Myxococcaceae bacterium]